MPGIVMMDGALRAFVDDTKTRRNTYLIGLFTNNRTPLRTDTFADYVEAAFPGYSRLVTNAWGNAATNGAGEAESIHPLLTWNASGSLPGQLVYGYLWIDGSGNLVAAEKRAAGPIDMSTSGATLTLVARATQRNRP